jgi:hypothetical protein
VGHLIREAVAYYLAAAAAYGAAQGRIPAEASASSSRPGEPRPAEASFFKRNP